MMKVFINPGHSSEYEVNTGIDNDRGACANGLCENQVAAETGGHLERILKSWGVEVVGNFQCNSLYEIADNANESDADVFVSIHCNAATPAALGTETFYCEGSSRGREVAGFVQRKLIDEMGTVDRGVKDDTQTQYDSIYVLRHTDMPAILVELAFITNDGDAELLRNNTEDFARAIASGLMAWAGLAVPDEQAQKEAAWREDLKEIQKEVVASELDTGSIEKIAVLARKYESNGDPACVSSGAGDLGGISYGLYQFASKVGVVDEFVAWLCDYPNPALANYGNVLAQHEVNSAAFIQQWKDLGTIDPGNFGRLQDEYIKEMYYEKASKLLCREDYCADKHTDAMRAVILSRAVQNGPTGAKNLFVEACGMLGHPNLSYVDDPYFDDNMIGAIYDFLIAECDSARPDGNGVYRSTGGFCNGSRGVIEGLRNRFVREKQDALDMLIGKKVQT